MAQCTGGEGNGAVHHWVGKVGLATGLLLNQGACWQTWPSMTGIKVSWSWCGGSVAILLCEETLWPAAELLPKEIQGQAVNKNTNKLYWDMAEDIQLCGNNGEPVVEECTWAFDKSAFSKYTGVDAERSIGGAWKQSQYQQGAGSCENITVILTISADGSTLQPMVIYSGKAFQIKWLQDNPVSAKWVKKTLSSPLNTVLDTQKRAGWMEKLEWSMQRTLSFKHEQEWRVGCGCSMPMAITLISCLAF